MRRLHSKALWLAVAIFSLWSFSGCGGSAKAGPPLFPGRINVSPGTSSLVVGGTLRFSASATTSSGTTLAVPITFSSSNTSILTLAPNGFACAGQWDILYTTCTPGGTGAVLVTASALNANSVPTYVFVHPPIDSITVTGILLDGVPIQEPCLSQSQSMTVQAFAYSQGVDITASVGPFTFSANNPSVVNLIAVVTNPTYNFATNQATATALVPGMTQIYASAGGVSSSSFQQPLLQNSQGTTSPALDFFATCPIQEVALELSATGSQQTGQTTFVTAKGTSQTATAILTDVMGNSSLANTKGGIVLNKIPLTWSSSQPAVLSVTSGCNETCTLSTPLAGSATVTASCSPPTCNVGFPLVPASLSSPAALASCTQFFSALYPKLINCQQIIPAPVYADVAISGLITGATVATSAIAGSTDCAQENPAACATAVYSLTPSTGKTGAGNPLPSSANSLLFDLVGDKLFEGSDYGAQEINPANFGTTTPPYTPLGTVTGRILAATANGSNAIFSDLVHSPNQVYVVNTLNPGGAAVAPLNISGAVAAAFSPDGLKAFILSPTSPTCPNAGCLYVYSTLQALQTIPLSAPASGVVFSSTGAFAFLNGGSATSTVTAVSTCNNTVSPLTITLPDQPLLLRILPAVAAPLPVLNVLTGNGVDPLPAGLDILVGLDSTGLDVVATTTSGGPCPQSISLAANPVTAQVFNPLHVELGLGTIQPVNFFTSADGSQIYIASTTSASILIYDFGTGSVTGIELQGNATPLSADMSPDAGSIIVAGSDGMLHLVSTAFGGSDQVPLSFPNLSNYANPFCTFTPAQGACKFNTVLARP